MHFLSGWEMERPQAGAEWKEKAACKRVSKSEVSRIFFPEVYTRETRAEAHQICEGCPVIDDCFRYAVGMPSLEGIWAKTTEQERKAIRLRKAKSRWNTANRGSRT